MLHKWVKLYFDGRKPSVFGVSQLSEKASNAFKSSQQQKPPQEISASYSWNQKPGVDDVDVKRLKKEESGRGSGAVDNNRAVRHKA